MTLPEIQQGTTLLFDKPFDWSSYDVVKKIVRLTRAKAGHAGTLDPYATGLLIVCTGKFTKKISEFQNLEKEYTGTLEIGATTPSFDMETVIDNQYETSHITEELIRKTASGFEGEIMQAPPAFSAAMIDGHRAYKKARRGETFELQKKKVMLHHFDVMSINFPRIDFKIVCGKGFYVRALVNDFGKALNSGAYLTALCRTRIGSYKLEDAWQMNDFAKFVESELRQPSN